MSLMDALLKDFLKKRNKLYNPELEEKVPEHLRISVETRMQFSIWSLTKCIGNIFKRLVEDNEEITWKQIDNAWAKGFFDFIDEFLTSDDVMPAIKMLKGKTTDFTVLGDMVALWDYIQGCVDVIIEKDEDHGRMRTIHCSTWEYLEDMGMQDKINCAPGCLYGIERVIKYVNPNIKIVGPRDGAEIGCPGLQFHACKAAGDPYCELEARIERKPEKSE